MIWSGQRRRALVEPAARVKLDLRPAVVGGGRVAVPGSVAGHLAVLPPAERLGNTGKLAADAGLEMAAIAWSWAALSQLRMPPEIVFHAQGYRGGSAAIIAAFGAGTGFGVPLLEWMGMTLTGDRATAARVPPFPHMLLWLRPRGVA